MAAELWATRHPAASSIMAYPEGRAALAAARRIGRLSAKGLASAVEDFRSAQGELLRVGIDEALALEAGELAQDLGLRGYDAVHLASALVLGTEITFVTWDEVLALAAKRCGCAVAPAL